MCIAIPSKVIEVRDGSAVVERAGERIEVQTFMLYEPLAVGDYVVCQAGRFATAKVDAASAEQALELFEEYAGLLHPGADA